MNVQVTSRPTAQAPATSKLAIADGDIHPQRNSYKDLFPYMEARWVEMAKTFGSRPRQAYQAGPAYPKGQPNASRRDAWPPEGGRPGSSLAFMQKQLLDENNIQLGILNPTGDNGSSFQNREFGNGVASAMNRWVEAEWLTEPRLKGSIVVPYEDADAAVAEIERWAGDPRFVQVLMVTRTANPPGQKQVPGRSTRPPPPRTCPSACTPSVLAATPSPAAAGRPSTSRTWSATRNPRSPSSPAW